MDKAVDCYEKSWGSNHGGVGFQKMVEIELAENSVGEEEKVEEKTYCVGRTKRRKNQCWKKISWI